MDVFRFEFNLSVNFTKKYRNPRQHESFEPVIPCEDIDEITHTSIIYFKFHTISSTLLWPCISLTELLKEKLEGTTYS